jgi:hypothetical protein
MPTYTVDIPVGTEKTVFATPKKGTGPGAIQSVPTWTPLDTSKVEIVSIAADGLSASVKALQGATTSNVRVGATNTGSIFIADEFTVNSPTPPADHFEFST